MWCDVMYIYYVNVVDFAFFQYFSIFELFCILLGIGSLAPKFFAHSFCIFSIVAGSRPILVHYGRIVARLRVFPVSVSSVYRLVIMGRLLFKSAEIWDSGEVGR